MLVSAIASTTLSLCNSNFLFCPHSLFLPSSPTHPSIPSPSHRRVVLLTKILSNTSSRQNPNPDALYPLTHATQEPPTVPSASALASAIRMASTSPVEFVQQVDNLHKSGIVLPSPDFHRLCVEQLDLFRRIVDPDAILSVYVRPAGSYVMDRLELRRVILYPEVDSSASATSGDMVILVGHFNIPTGLRAAEAALSDLQVQVIPESNAVIFPMVKHPFVVGFLVAELPLLQPTTIDTAQTEGHDSGQCVSIEEAYSLPPIIGKKPWDIQSINDNPTIISKIFTSEQRSNAINISRSLAMAYVMDQKAMLLQQSSWQNNVRMSHLVEQIRGPITSLRTLSKMLSTQVKRSEIASDIIEDMLVQGDRLRDTLQQLQDAVYLTKANIVRYNEEALKKMNGSTNSHTAESARSQLSSNFPSVGFINKMQNSSKPLSLGAAPKDLEMPLPPFALAPLQQGIRPCNVSQVLGDLVDAVRPLAHKQQRLVDLCELSLPLLVAVEEPALRQALSNLIEGSLLRTHVGGKVEIVSTDAPAGGSLIIIDDDGPDMHYMTQMHSLTPYGAELFSENMVEDNMTWNFVAGLAIAREILESYGCVVRVISPRITDAAPGAGGTRIELWLPSSMAISDLNSQSHEL